MAVSSVGAANKHSQEHDRDDHAATYVGNRKFHVIDTNGVFRTKGRHWIRGQRPHQTQAGLGQRDSVEAAEYSRYSSNGLCA